MVNDMTRTPEFARVGQELYGQLTGSTTGAMLRRNAITFGAKRYSVRDKYGELLFRDGISGSDGMPEEVLGIINPRDSILNEFESKGQSVSRSDYSKATICRTGILLIDGGSFMDAVVFYMNIGKMFEKYEKDYKHPLANPGLPHTANLDDFLKA